MASKLNNSIVFIKSSESKDAFGTGFVILHDHAGTHIVTCAHVVNDIIEAIEANLKFTLTKKAFTALRNKKVPNEILERLTPLENREFLREENDYSAPCPQKIKFWECVEEHLKELDADKYKALILKHAEKRGKMYVEKKFVPEIEAIGEEEGVDLAVLLVKEKELRNMPSLTLCESVNIGENIETEGFYYSSPGYECFHLDGIVTNTGGLPVMGPSGRLEIWRVEITDNETLKHGYSGSPAVIERTGKVFGVFGKGTVSEKEGVVISCTALREIWPDIPQSLFEGIIQPEDVLIGNTGESDASSFELDLFVNRENEKRAFEKIIEGNSPQRYLEFSGIVGQGKTQLLKWIHYKDRNCQKRKYLSTYIDFLKDQQLHSIIIKIVSDLSGQVQQSFEITEQFLNLLKDKINENVLKSLYSLKNMVFSDKDEFLETIRMQIGETQTIRYEVLILKHATKIPFHDFKKNLSSYYEKLSLYKQSQSDYKQSQTEQNLRLSEQNLRLLRKIEEKLEIAFHRYFGTLLEINKIVLCLDNAEKTSFFRAEFWMFEEQILKKYRKCPNFVLVAATQEEVSWKDSEISSQMHRYKLLCLQPPCVKLQVKSLLDKQKIHVNDVEFFLNALLELTHGHPLSTYTVISFWTKEFSSPVEKIELNQEFKVQSSQKLIGKVIEEQILDNFQLDQDLPPVVEILSYLAPIRRIELSRVKSILPLFIREFEGKEESFYISMIDALRDYYLFLPCEDSVGFRLKPVVRDILLSDMHLKGNRTDTHKVLAKYYENLIDQNMKIKQDLSQGQEVFAELRYVVEELYHLAEGLYSSNLATIESSIQSELKKKLQQYFTPQFFGNIAIFYDHCDSLCNYLGRDQELGNLVSVSMLVESVREHKKYYG